MQSVLNLALNSDPLVISLSQAEALELLQMLKMPQDELQREWLSERRTALQTAMTRSGDAFWEAHRAAGGGGAGSAGEGSADVHEFVRQVDRAFLTELIKTANQYKDVRDGASSELMHPTSSLLLACICELIHPALSSS